MKTIEYTGTEPFRTTTHGDRARSWGIGEAITLTDEEADALLADPEFIDKATTQPPDYHRRDNPVPPSPEAAPEQTGTVPIDPNEAIQAAQAILGTPPTAAPEEGQQS